MFLATKKKKLVPHFYRHIFHCKQNIAAKKRFDLKSNRQYFDFKSNLDHARKKDLIEPTAICNVESTRSLDHGS
jgi:hypothetical protein